MTTPEEVVQLSEGVTKANETDTHLTYAMANAVGDYMFDLMLRLGMPEWKIFVSAEPADVMCLASIEPAGDRYIASISLCQQWMDLDRDTQVMTLTHETLHLLHHRMDALVMVDISPHFSVSEHALVRTQWRHETEFLVEHLANFMARTLTLKQSWQKMLRRHKVYSRK